MGATASQITSLTIVYSIVYSDEDQRKHQSSASLAFTRKMFPFDDVIMIRQLTMQIVPISIRNDKFHYGGLVIVAVSK